MDTGSSNAQPKTSEAQDCSEEEKKSTVLQCAISDTNAAALPGADVLTEILFSPNENTCFFLDVVSVKELERYTQPLDDAAKKLMGAANSEKFHSDALCEAKANLLKELHKIGSATPNDVEKLEPLADGSVPDDFPFKEVLSLKEKQYKLVPKKFLNSFEDKPKHFFKLPKSINESFKDAVTLEEYEEEAKKDESIDKKLAKAAIKDIVDYLKNKVSKEWKLEYKNAGTLSSKLAVQGVAPWLAKFISDESFEAIDKWVDDVNEGAKWSVNQHKASIEKAIKSLKKPVYDRNKSVLTLSEKGSAEHYFLSQDWDFARRMVRDVWGDDHELFVRLSPIAFNIAKDPEYRRGVIDQLMKTPLPKVQWDASAGAQLMRYSLGASAGAEFTLWKGGRVAISADAKADFSLVEAKAAGTFYIPDSGGHSIKPKVHVKKESYGTKPFSDSRSDGKTHFINDKNAVPYFAVDCCLLSPGGAAAMFNVLKLWSATAPQAPRLQQSGERPFFLQVEGYTSATGSEAHNQALGALRAYAVVDFITQNTASWVGNFKCGRWGREEIDFMAFANIILDQPDKFEVDWSLIGLENKKVPLVNQLLKKYPELAAYRANISPDYAAARFIEGDIWEETTSGNLMAKSILAGQTYSEGRKNFRVPRVQALIERYFANLYAYACEQNGLDTSAYPKLLKNICLHEVPAVSYGESKLKLDVQEETFQNRRCEFLAYEIDPSKTEIDGDDVELYLGDIRCAFEGTLSGWAGANVQLGAKVQVSCPEGMLNIIGTNELPEEANTKNTKTANNKDFSSAKSKSQAPGADAEVTGAAFAGVKGEVGVKAIVDWQKPPAADGTTVGSKGFMPFGSIGYTATGMLGAGLGGEFKIGWDRRSGSFIVKVKASVALGPGAGGELDIAVGTANLWEFAVFVFEEIRKHNFSHVEIFETHEEESGVDVFDVFCSWGWKLFAVTGPIAGVAMVASAYSDELLADAISLTYAWQKRELDIDHLKATITNINNDVELLRVLLPETKSRMLYELIIAPYSLGERFSNIVDLDFNKQREEAAKKVILHGIHTKNDWWETLEHMGEFDGDQFVPYVKSGATDEEKLKRRNANLQYIRSELLNDTADWAEIDQHIKNLPE